MPASSPRVASRRTPEIEVFHWNPEWARFGGRLGRRIPLRRRVNNFGDLLGPVIVDGMLRRLGLQEAVPVRDAQLLTIGSVLHFARPGAVIWGSGVNGKVGPERHVLSDLDVRAVRGPRTRAFLVERGFEVPEVYGDPAMLLGAIRPDLLDVPKRHDVTIVPNLEELGDYRGQRFLNPRSPLEHCLQTIAASRLVVGSSLHGVIVADALGVPARLVRSRVEGIVKYEDHYISTGRPGFRPAASVAEAIELGGEPPAQWAPDRLMEAFPADLWGG